MAAWSHERAELVDARGGDAHGRRAARSSDADDCNADARMDDAESAPHEADADPMDEGTIDEVDMLAVDMSRGAKRGRLRPDGCHSVRRQRLGSEGAYAGSDERVSTGDAMESATSNAPGAAIGAIGGSTTMADMHVESGVTEAAFSGRASGYAEAISIGSNAIDAREGPGGTCEGPTTALATSSHLAAVTDAVSGTSHVVANLMSEQDAREARADRGEATDPPPPVAQPHHWTAWSAQRHNGQDRTPR